MEKFGMQNCETFIRGTIRFSGFSNVISAFHDIGLTSDDHIPDGVATLRDLAEVRFRNTPFENMEKYDPHAQKAIRTLC
jgi:saccharopine dehydrogenase-like NADP-dependent oxidoreductase